MMKRIVQLTLGFSLVAYMQATHAAKMIDAESATSSTPNTAIATDISSTVHANNNKATVKARKAAKAHRKLLKSKQSITQHDIITPVAQTGTNDASFFLDKDAAINHVMEGHGIVPFVSLEGFPAWINFGGITVTRNDSTHTADEGNFLSGGVRVGAGFVYPYTSKVDLTAETAWNYFGSTSGKVSANSISATMSGVDLLVGALYKRNNYELFAKVGALFQRTGYSISMPNTSVITIDTDTYYLAVNSSGSVMDVLPEVKLGLNYDLNARWAASVAYMHAFGGTPSVDLSSVSTGTTVQGGISTNLRGATLNSILFGLKYNFVNS